MTAASPPEKVEEMLGKNGTCAPGSTRKLASTGGVLPFSKTGSITASRRASETSKVGGFKSASRPKFDLVTKSVLLYPMQPVSRKGGNNRRNDWNRRLAFMVWFWLGSWMNWSPTAVGCRHGH